MYKLKLNILDIYPFLNKRRKFQLICFAFLTVISGLCESLTIASLFSFISVLTKPENLQEIRIVKNILNILDINDSSELLLPLTIFFCFAILSSGIIRILNLAISTKLAALIGNDLSFDSFKKTLNQPYRTHINRNSSKTISTITDYITSTTAALNAFLQMICSLVISLFLFTTLIILNIKVASVVIVIITLFYILISFLVRKRFKSNSLITSYATKEQIKSIQEGLGAIRDILLSDTQFFYLNKFKISDRKKRIKQAENIFLGTFPKYVLESVGIILISIITFQYSKKGYEDTEIIAFLAALALGAQKLLPACQQVYINWSAIKACNYQIDGVLHLLKQKIEFKDLKNNRTNLNLKKSLIIKNLNFSYDKASNFTLSKINLTINKGDRLGIIGKTGSGKSTLLDLIMGLLTPDSGQIIVDGKNLLNSKNINSWRASIAHVPQNIFLTDASIEENIALGINKNYIDYELIKKCAQKAQLEDFISNLSKGYKTFIGERGIKLSGGQKQRIGIARALYKKANLLILDEATSALDNKTEAEFLKTLDNINKDITLVIVAHRLTTIKKCNRVIELNKGEIIEHKDYDNF